MDSSDPENDAGRNEVTCVLHVPSLSIVCTLWVSIITRKMHQRSRIQTAGVIFFSPFPQPFKVKQLISNKRYVVCSRVYTIKLFISECIDIWCGCSSLCTLLHQCLRLNSPSPIQHLRARGQIAIPHSRTERQAPAALQAAVRAPGSSIKTSLNTTGWIGLFSTHIKFPLGCLDSNQGMWNLRETYQMPKYRNFKTKFFYLNI